NPFAAGRALALEGEKAFGRGDAGKRRDERCGVLRLVGVRIGGVAGLTLKSAHRDAMRGEDDGSSRGPHVAEAVRKGFGEERMVGPGFRKVDGHISGFLEDSAAVESNRGAGVLRRKADGGKLADAVGAHFADGVRDIGLPVSHADINRHTEVRWKKLSLQMSDASERARADERIT